MTRSRVARDSGRAACVAITVGCAALTAACPAPAVVLGGTWTGTGSGRTDAGDGLLVLHYDAASPDTLEGTCTLIPAGGVGDILGGRIVLSRM